VTGCLVEPEKPQALAAALTRLIGDPALRARLAAAGETRVRHDFPLEHGIDRIASRLAASLGPREEDTCASRSMRR
jgi:hypothetical protein